LNKDAIQAAVYAAAFVEEFYAHARRFGSGEAIEADRMLRFHEEAETVAELWAEHVWPTLRRERVRQLEELILARLGKDHRE
jgi:hypothetical protein